jgi:chromosome segregation ATPase
MKLGNKEILIIVLGAALVLSLIFRPAKKIDYYEDEINSLKQQNELLYNSNDSLKSQNSELTKEIRDILITIDSTEAKLADTEIKLNNLENGKGKVSDRVRVLNADGVAGELSDYLNKKK